MAAPPCNECKHYRPDTSSVALWGLKRKAADEYARCAMPQLPTTRYSLSERGNVLLMNRTGELLFVETVRKMSVLCGPEGDFWEPAEKKTRLTRAKEFVKKASSRFKWKRRST